MAPQMYSAAEYRNRLDTSKNSRRRRMGPVDVDEFFVPPSPTKVTHSKRSKTPTPSSNYKTVADEEVRRAKSTPRAPPLAAERFQKQAYLQEQEERSRRQRPTAMTYRNPSILREPSFLKRELSDESTGLRVKDERRRRRSRSRGRENENSRSNHSRNPTRTNPRQYAANYYATKLAPKERSERRKTRRRSVSPTSCGETGRLVTDHLSACLLQTVDIYQPESKSGRKKKPEGDDIFFYNGSGAAPETAKSRGRSRKPNRSRRKKNDKNSIYESSTSSSSSSSTSELQPPKVLNLTHNNNNNNVPEKSSPTSVMQREDEDTPSLNFNDKSSMPPSAPQQGGKVSPQIDAQRRPRGRYETMEDHTTQKHLGKSLFDESSVSPKTGVPENPIPRDDLRTLRLALFQQDQRNLETKKRQEVDDVLSLRYARALEDLTVQGKSIQKLQNELRDTTSALEQTKFELMQSRAESAKRSHALEETSAKVFRERIDVEEKLRKEMLTNQRFREQLIDLEKEVARLKIALKHAQDANAGPAQPSLVARNSSGSSTNPQAPRSAVAANPTIDSRHQNNAGDSEENKEIERLSAEVLTLRSDVVDLRAQLAEARAERISSGREMAQLKQERDDALVGVASLNKKLEGMQKEAEDLKRQLEVSNDKGKDNADELKGELMRVRKELEESYIEKTEFAEKNRKLEDELREVRAQASMREFQATDVIEQLERAKSEAHERALVSDEDVKELQNELQEIKEKLSQSNSAIIRQTAEHLKEKIAIENDLFQTREMARALQQKVLSMDDDIANAEALQARMQEENNGETGYRGTARIMEILRKGRNSI